MSDVTNAVEKAWETLKRIFGEIKTAVSDLANMVGSVFGTALEKASAAWENVKSVFSFGETKLKIADPASIKAAQKATATLKTNLLAVSNIDTSSAMTKLVALKEAGGKIQTALESSIRRAQAFLSNMSFYKHGAALMNTLAAGIRARSQAVVSEVQKVTQAMRDHLPSSPAKIGPLSDIHKLRFDETIAASIRAAPMVCLTSGKTFSIVLALQFPTSLRYAICAKTDHMTMTPGSYPTNKDGSF